MYYNASERNRRRRRKRVTSFVLVSLITLGVIVGVFIVVSQKPDLKSTMRRMPFSPSDSYVPFEHGIFYIAGTRLYHINTKDEMVFDIKIPANDVSMQASNSAVVLHNNASVWVINLKGEQLFSASPVGTIISVRSSEKNVAVLTRDDSNMLHISFYDMLGSLLETYDSSRHILDYGFLQNGSFWVMALDTSGITPVCYVTTYKDASETVHGLISIKDQIVQRLVFTEKTIYAIGTEHIVACDYLNNISSSVLVYGWNVQDVAVLDNQPVVLLSPRTEKAGTPVINAAKIITFPEGNYTLQLPAECFKVLLAKDKVYAFSPNMLYTFSQKGKPLDEYALPVEVSSIRKCYSNSILATSGSDIYLLQLP